MSRSNFKGKSFYPIRVSLALLTTASMYLLSCDVVEQKITGFSDESFVVSSPNDERDYALIQLENGLEVMLVSDPTVEKSAAALSVGLGASSDPNSYPGMAHYLEHMLFMGSARFPEPDGFMAFTSEHGGSSNAYTGLNITNYMMSVENDAFAEGLDQFSSFFKAPLFDPTYIEKEKNAVNAEWSMRREQDFRITYRLARKLLGHHPANRFQIGNLESLADKTDGGLHAATIAFFEQNYSANLMKASLISPEALPVLLEQAELYFGDIPNKDLAKPEITEVLDFEKVGKKLIRYAPKEDLRELRLDFLIDDNTQLYKSKPSEYLAYILGSEMPNTPAVKLRELGWASSLMVSADPSRYGNYGLFSLNVELTEAGLNHREDIISMLLGYLEMLRGIGIDDRYASEFGTSLSNNFKFLEKMDDFTYAHQLTQAMQVYPSNDAIQAPYLFTEFDSMAVMQVLDQLVHERLHVWYIDRDQHVEESLHFYDGEFLVEPLEVPSPSQILSGVEEYKLSLPAKNMLLPEQFEIFQTAGRPQLVVDDPGLSVWLQGSEVFADLPRGYAQVYLNSSFRQEQVEAAVMLSVWSDLYNLNQTPLINEAGVAGMGLNFRIGEGLRFTVSGFTDKQPELLSAALRGLRVSPTEQEFVEATDRYARNLENRKRELPVRQLGRTLSQLTTTGYYDEASLFEAASSLTLERFTQFVEKLLEASNIRVYLFGNYDEGFARRLSSEILEELPRDTSFSGTYVRARVYSPEDRTSLIFNGNLPVDDLGMMLLYAASEPTLANEACGRVISQHLRNRTFDTLRTQEQLGYAAGGLAGKLQDHPFLGFYIQTPVNPPVKMLERFDQFAVEYGQMLKSMTAEQFENLKSGAVTNLMESPKNLAEEASPYISDWNKENYAFDTRERLISAVESVSLIDIQRYYRDTVLVEAPTKILVQLLGERWTEEPFAMIDGAKVVKSVEAFHKNMPVQMLR